MIGIFDSGIGGLTVVKEIKKRFPDHKLVYFGDTARLPYGTKSHSTILRYSKENVGFLIEKGSTIIIVACNTASAHAAPELKKQLTLPIFDVISPAVRAAKAATQNNRIGVIGTPATIISGAYQKEFSAPFRIFSQACPLFVPLIEENWTARKETYSIARTYLEPLQGKKIDTLILGCTHYPLLSRVIHDIMGEEVRLINSAQELTRDLEAYLKDTPMELARAKDEYYVSDEPYRFENLSRSFLGRPVEVKQVNILTQRQ